MHYLRTTPLGRMANACRDNPERAQFVGYDPRMVRFLQFTLAGFFAGVGDGLYAITYEIVTYDAVNAPLTANARSLPLRMCGRAEGRLAKTIGNWLPSTSMMAGATP